MKGRVWGCFLSKVLFINIDFGTAHREVQSYHNFYNNYNHRQQQKHQEEQQLLPMSEQNMNPMFGVVEVNGTATSEIDDDDDEEEILLTVHIPSKSLLHQ